MSKVIIDGVEYVPKVEEVKEWPQHNDEYWCVTEVNADTDTLRLCFAKDSDVDNARKKAGNCFPTEQKAEYERLRRECMATRWVPEEGAKFYGYDFALRTIVLIETSYLWNAEALLGLLAPTDEEAKARWDMYGDAWLDALDVTTKK